MPKKYKPFLEAKDLPAVGYLPDGTPIKIKARRRRKPRLGQRYNGKHKD